ncbi:hypothetical protein [Brevundimonas pondensis]|uniref:hypothetical protein n=1 Tax=Brevundimonas pondensis TaxID=2774189 RepID=UPI001CEDD8FE|nr:hypothetical protein [Brevundimonas pondensis]
MGRFRLLGGAAAAALLFAPGAVWAQDANAAPRGAHRPARSRAEQPEVRGRRRAHAAECASPGHHPSGNPPGRAAAPTPVSTTTREEGFRIGDHTVKFGGFVKVDAMASSYSGGDPANGDLLRDYHLPGSIPIGGAEEDTALDFNARQTRFWLTTDGLVGGRKVGTRLEMDFQSLPGTGDQRITSASTPPCAAPLSPSTTG